MINTVDYWIRTEIVDNNRLSEGDREYLLRQNDYNRNQLEKHFNEYLSHIDLKKMEDDKVYFDRITGNAFKSYKSKVYQEAIDAEKKNRNKYKDMEENY